MNEDVNSLSEHGIESNHINNSPQTGSGEPDIMCAAYNYNSGEDDEQEIVQNASLKDITTPSLRVQSQWYKP